MTNSRELFNEKPVYTLSEIAMSLQKMISKVYQHTYYIKAEILKLNYYPRSGHCYPELVEKENGKIKAQLRGIIWASQFQSINERFIQITGEPLKEEIGVLCFATIEFNPEYGLSLHIKDIEPTYTLGEMAKNRKDVIELLKKEGIFSLNKQKKLPLLPQRIAIISVETSKGYNDFTVTLQQNSWNYKFQHQLFSSILQGDKAIIAIPQQLEIIEKRHTDFDCVVILRGGGGDVGMSCYDSYPLASAVAKCSLPVITGIGHSTNETVTDMVAYENKITPTDVAYFLIQKFHDFAIQVDEIQNHIAKIALNILKEKHFHLETTQQRLLLTTQQYLTVQKNILEQLDLKTRLLHPEHVLKRGYSITYYNGKAIKNAKALPKDGIMTTKFYEGEVVSKVCKD